MPTTILIPQNVSAHTGDQVSYTCFVSGTNKTLLNCQWYFRPNGETNIRQLVNGEKYNWSCKHCSEPYRYSLHITIKDVANDDTGNYFCEANTSVRNEAQLRVYDRHDSRQQSEEETTGSSLSNQVVHVVSAVAAMVFIALIALIVVIIFFRRRAKPNPRKRSENGQQQPSPSKNIYSGNGNGNPEIYILQLENPNYVEVILKSNTHIDKSTSTEDIYGHRL
ncbi:hypothetical protein CHS0354_028452 [Potamilus streckersoni]|uniref:Ig-like domain-containing protein n=1 Tax=Potamilus streckersoni TaxID=2493646 RepID=A0AAE0SBK6_9BIVA|nr:hypothetical protein CHS0354_028452 [Potamilus streckersoni]